MATIHVRGVGFQNSNNTIFLNDVEPFESALIADIDSNGFEELYIITRSVGSGSFAKIYGIATMDGSSYKLIFNPENDKKVNYNFDYLDQYRGHDSIYIENKQLRRSFPLFNENDKKCCPTEGKRILTYKLVTYENALTLHVYKVQ